MVERGVLCSEGTVSGLTSSLTGGQSSMSALLPAATLDAARMGAGAWFFVSVDRVDYLDCRDRYLFREVLQLARGCGVEALTENLEVHGDVNLA